MPCWKQLGTIRPPLRLVAGHLEAVWRDYTPPRPVYSLEVPLRYGEKPAEIDLGTVEGRRELMALAVLEAARVHPEVAETTFLELRRRKLLEQEVLLASAAGEKEIAAVLAVYYRALADHRQKAVAIVKNARLLKERFGGDPANIYFQVGGTWSRVLEELQGFAQIKNRAFWLCREFCRHGIWPRTNPKAYLLVDRHVRTALWRLGFVGRMAQSLREVSLAECREKIETYFTDTLPLFYQGRERCRTAEYWACREKCQVKGVCFTFLQEGKRRQIKNFKEEKEK